MVFVSVMVRPADNALADFDDMPGWAKHAVHRFFIGLRRSSPVTTTKRASFVRTNGPWR
jgi:hypothetical protein